jgi:DNA-binding NarL/FixJ family response regulator
MPEIDGLEILEWASSNLPEVPTVMLSSSDLLSDRLAARNLGCKGYFSKDQILTDFLEFLRQWDETALARRGEANALTPNEVHPNVVRNSL